MSRAAGKQQRKQRVLAAVEDSIRAEGAVNFSMRELAEKAQVSFATPFNLFGSKEEILAALFNARVADQAEFSAARAATSEPLENLLHIAVSSCDAYIADAELFRPLIQAIRVQNSTAVETISQQARDIWTQALNECVADRTLAREINTDVIAKRLHLAFRMAFWMWASEQLNDAQFREHALHSTAACVLAVTTPKGRKQLHHLLQKEVAGAG